ncbi:hypothetical protein [Paenibacillus illinoisensis]|uniref:hypothetical protein n=1 Tax=Paenibacillus illinoisensis TaxID=59845 RepID=UPI003018D153
MEDKNYVICNVCGGRGGWLGGAKFLPEDPWVYCQFCSGFGFYEKEPDESSDNFFAEYVGYKKKIIEALTDSICEVKNYTTEDMGKTIEITIMPYNRGRFSDFVFLILKLSHYSTKINIRVIQEFLYKEETNAYVHVWKLVLEPNELSDLDGFHDIIKLWERNGGR